MILTKELEVSPVKFKDVEPKDPLHQGPCESRGCRILGEGNSASDLKPSKRHTRASKEGNLVPIELKCRNVECSSFGCEQLRQIPNRNGPRNQIVPGKSEPSDPKIVVKDRPRIKLSGKDSVDFQIAFKRLFLCTRRSRYAS